MITEYKTKKLIEYLKPGGKYRIDWGHGLGDLIMWYPLYERLKQIYSQCHFDLYCECGQEAIWGTVFDRDETGYDEVFSLDYPMSEGSNMMKTTKCAIDELGLSLEQIADITEVTTIPPFPSPLVGIHYHGTALPHSVGCPEPVAQQIWQEVKDCGLIPIECHFSHVFDNPINKRYPWIDVSVRNYKATLPNLFGLLQRCRAFIGVASGPFVAAVSMMPARTLYLERLHPLKTYISNPAVQSVKIDQYKSGTVQIWLENVINL